MRSPPPTLTRGSGGDEGDFAEHDVADSVIVPESTAAPTPLLVAGPFTAEASGGGGTITGTPSAHPTGVRFDDAPVSL